ncbi:transcription factor PHYTOCHROME INTERACTING FACTOR-LIKE 15-like [Solanum lycopersicum]|uniref:transcription factor PHYTOCHROME INTERACTING FACTOR-LIKE 15-like n=1 Tax=Solanum lycopersicum TaxID=4081 RepID=UPI00374A85CB
MSKWKLNFDSSCELVSDEKNICDQSISPQTLLTLGVPGVENHVYNFGTNYSSNPSIEKNSHKESRGIKRKCGEDLVYELDTNNGSGITSRRNEDGLYQYPKASCVEMHKMNERRRRYKIAKKMKVLETLIPNCNKSDRASVLDQAIQHIQALQHQIQVMSMDRIRGSTLVAAGRNQIMQSTLHFNPYIGAIGYFFNFSNILCSNFSPMLSTGSEFPFLPLAVACNLLHPGPIMEVFTRGSASVAPLEKRV